MEQKTVFHCWVCGCEVHEMHEIAQNLCDNCKASIVRKNKEHVPIDQFIENMRKNKEKKT